MFIPLLHTMVRRQLIRQGIQSRQIPLGHGMLHYYEASPQAPRSTIVLIHGLGTSASTWVNVLPALASTHRVLAPDLPGFGLSSPMDGIPTLEDFADFTERFVDHVAPDSFVLLGHSLGGWITMKYAVKHRPRVNHLILMDTAGIYYRGVDELRDLFILRSSRDTRKLLNRIWGVYPWYFRLFTSFIHEDLLRRNVPQIVQSVREPDFMNAHLQYLTMRVSVIWGGRDRLIPMDTVRILEEKLPARDIHILEEAAHVPQLQTPGLLVSTLNTILQEDLL